MWKKNAPVITLFLLFTVSSVFSHSVCQEYACDKPKCEVVSRKDYHQPKSVRRGRNGQCLHEVYIWGRSLEPECIENFRCVENSLECMGSKFEFLVQRVCAYRTLERLYSILNWIQIFSSPLSLLLQVIHVPHNFEIYLISELFNSKNVTVNIYYKGRKIN